MFGASNFSNPAHLIADPARAAMLAILLDGRALPAGELAFAAGVTAQTASSHLSKLLDGGLLAVEREGRHRYYRLAGSDVAEALERLSLLGLTQPRRKKTLTKEMRNMRFCRSCYGHLAGQMGVAVADALQRVDYLRATVSKRYLVTPNGENWFARIGVDMTALQPTARGLARQCLDCTERRHHVAGPLGVHLLTALCDQDWLRRETASRRIMITPRGWAAFGAELGIYQDDFVFD